MTYEPQPYPRMLYHSQGRQCVVPDAEAEAEKAAQGWVAHPHEVAAEAETPPVPAGGKIETWDSLTHERAAELHASTVDTVIARVREVPSIALLDHVLALEQQHPKVPGGRKGVLRAIEIRRQALTEPAAE